MAALRPARVALSALTRPAEYVPMKPLSPLPPTPPELAGLSLGSPSSGAVHAAASTAAKLTMPAPKETSALEATSKVCGGKSVSLPSDASWLHPLEQLALAPMQMAGLGDARDGEHSIKVSRLPAPTASRTRGPYFASPATIVRRRGVATRQSWRTHRAPPLPILRPDVRGLPQSRISVGLLGRRSALVPAVLRHLAAPSPLRPPWLLRLRRVRKSCPKAKSAVARPPWSRKR